ncbi:serine carboxypeptidase [Auriculariales sp. MPI-PUGE-AT-0066]|nr:serine carboxypeptidase [Auriculariales sp. MPI-PUGE-AT-0066]
MYPRNLLLALAAPLAVMAQQAFFASPVVDLPVPEQDLHALSETEFTTFMHPSYPKHRVRVKKTTGWCDTTGAASFTGYIDIDAHHLFFYFFESRNKPAEDPVLMWINGSSAMGLFDELGPCSIGKEEKPIHNPWSWSNNASVFFLDQPVRVGFSYADHGEKRTTSEAAVDFAAFATIFFESFTKFKGLPFHMSGESYAGRYLPEFAAALYDANTLAVTEGRTPVNLQSVIIGNGFTTMLHMCLSSYDLLCTSASVEPLLPISVCVRMKTVMPRCKKWYTASCVNSFDTINCEAAMEFCMQELFFVQGKTGRDPYDLTYPCDSPPNSEVSLCYRESENEHIESYLNRANVRKMLGVDKAVGNFSMSSGQVNMDFAMAGDLMLSSRPHTVELLERGIRVLSYVGTYDWIANWVGNLRSANELEWSGANRFRAAELREWSVQGKKAGIVKSFGPFTFATVDSASHLVPREKPEESLAMLNRWLSEKPL